MNKNCEMCGSPMGNVHASRRFCYECADIRRKEQESWCERKKREAAGGVLPCQFCGAPTTGDRRRRCPACASKSAGGKRDTSKPKALEKPPKLRKKPLRHCWDLNNKSTTQVCVEADALGLSYGQYSCLIDTLMIERHLADIGIHDGLERIDRAWKQFKKDKRERERRIAERIAQVEADGRELAGIEVGEA